MLQRFVDNKEIISEKYNFVKREHGIHGLWLALIFSIALGALIFNWYYASNSALFISISFFIISLLFTFTIYSATIDKENVATLEFQNALLAGATKLATEFCIIMRHDGKVVYVDPEFSKNYSIYVNKGMSEIEALCKIGKISAKDKKKLLNALSEGISENLQFQYVESGNNKKPLALTLNPIGIPSEKKYERTVNLAVNPISRPSGHFLLRIQKHIDEIKCVDYFNYLNFQDSKNITDATYKFFDNFNIVFFSINKSGKILSSSSSINKELGYSNDYIDENKLKIDNLIKDKSALEILKSYDGNWCGRVDFISKNKKKSPAIVSKIITFDNKEKPIGIHIAATFANDLSALEISSDNDKSGNTTLVESSPIPTAIIDKSGTIIECNDLFNQIFENANENTTIFDLISKDNKQTLEESITNLLDSNKNYLSTDINIEGDNENTASLYLGKLSSLGQIIIHLIDTTDFKNLELEFVHSQKMQAVGQLAGGIAHDFNNLLTAMIGFCDLLLMRHPAGDPSFADIMQIKQNANRAANLVRQLLAFSRKQTLQPKILRIADILADLSNLIGRLIGENIELNMVHGRDLGNVKVDLGQLEQVIINLAVNARDAMPEGGTLTIRTNNHKISKKNKIDKDLIPPAEDEVIEHGDYVLIEVEDNGVGVDKKVIDKMFEPFFSTKEIGSGTGLGLSTVYGIIKQTGGYIYVSSKIGKGTKFSIFLKRYDDEELEEEKLYEEISPIADTSDLTGKGNILLVEDETPVRIFSNSALTNKGYSVLEAECGEDALSLIKEHGPEIDIIITDVVMPGMTGPSMIKEVMKEYPDIKVIFISGYAEDAFKETYGIEREFNFLSKPYTLKQLVTKVKEVLEGDKAKV